MMQNRADTGIESDRFGATPHPRLTHELFGHAEAERELYLSYHSGRLPQAIIIGGPPGIGKATLAWRIARFLLAYPDLSACPEKADFSVLPGHPVARQIAALSHPDIVLLRREWNPETSKLSSQIAVDDIRRAIHMFQQAAGQGGYRVALIDCAEDLNASSANALLKVVEEPPPRSLFLIVAHRPGRMLATLRSRCRSILLKPLGPADMRNIIRTLGEPWSCASEAMLANAVARAQGSIHDVLRLLDEGSASTDAALRSLLEALPRIDWVQVHALAERVSARDGAKEYEMMRAAIEDWLTAKVREGARAAGGACVRQLAPYALIWEKLAEAAREAEVYNLDKRPLVLSIFAELAMARGATLG